MSDLPHPAAERSAAPLAEAVERLRLMAWDLENGLAGDPAWPHALARPNSATGQATAADLRTVLTALAARQTAPAGWSREQIARVIRENVRLTWKTPYDAEPDPESIEDAADALLALPAGGEGDLNPQSPPRSEPEQ